MKKIKHYDKTLNLVEALRQLLIAAYLFEMEMVQGIDQIKTRILVNYALRCYLCKDIMNTKSLL